MQSQLHVDWLCNVLGTGKDYWAHAETFITDRLAGRIKGEQAIFPQQLLSKYLNLTGFSSVLLCSVPRQPREPFLTCYVDDMYSRNVQTDSKPITGKGHPHPCSQMHKECPKAWLKWQVLIINPGVYCCVTVNDSPCRGNRAHIRTRALSNGQFTPS
jgi:hypothetical protein